jgi:hypothetical protein
VSGNGISARVDALEADGRLLDAIDAFRIENAGADPGSAERLLRLRHRAFPTLAGDVADSWPPTLPDPFPGVAAVPELRVDGLSSETVGGSILHHGSVIVRELASRAAVDAIADGIERSFGALDAWLDDDTVESEWFAPFTTAGGDKPAMRKWVRAGGGVWAVESPLVATRILDLYHGVGLRELLTGYFGEPPALAIDKLTLRRVGPDTFPSWHQDGSFLGPEVRSVNVWLTLTDCGGDASVPGLELVPRRVGELLETGTRGAPMPNSIGHDLVEEVAGTDTIVRPRFRAGDALLFDDRLVHRSAVDPDMRGVRYAVESWFFSPSYFPGTYDGLAF